MSSGSSVAEAVSQAQAILEAAETRSKEMLEKAEASFREAKETGYQEGFAAGKQEAVTTAIHLIEESGSLSTTLAEKAATLALAICQSLLEQELKLNPDVAKTVALKALRESAITDSITIVINPEDKSALDKGTAELQRVVGNAKLLVSTDSSLTRGGCIVRTDFGEVDATIESLLQGIATRLGVRREK